MKIFLIVFTLLALVSTFFVGVIKDALFNGGGTWYWSNLLPYVLCYIATVALIVLLILSKLKTNLKFFAIATILLFPAIQFWIAPIYQGDFSDDSTDIIVNQLPTNKEDAKDGLIMLSLSGCKYCYQTLPTLNLIKERAPETKISIAVLTTNPNAITYYQEQTNNELNVFMVDSLGLKNFSTLSPKGSYPAFLYLENGKITKRWSDNQFGYAAKDFIEGK